ncbi:MAG: hypothetical protein BGO49_23925 [Planctomycetales bacterium 71-10]|nr:MAG: hypothetical protein BGO49_23925 [Planctomycetales bacterium 71-10]
MATRKPKTMAEQLREAIIRENARPSKDQIRSMIEHGSINEKGEVLLKSPLTEAPKDRARAGRSKDS